MEFITFHNQQTIPAIGLGTAAIGAWQQDDGYVVDTVLKAIELGYRHIDTASLYGNERSVGKAIKESGLPREAFFVTTKVWDTQQGFDSTTRALNESLNRLQLDYVDLYLVHWPYPEKTKDTWLAMENAHSENMARSLGLSNFRQQDIEALLLFASIKPVYNQLELHPYLTQQPLTDFCKANNIVVSSWSPLGSGTWSGVPVSEKPISDPVINAIAEQHGVSTGQVILKWNLQRGRIAIPKAESEKNLKNNLTLSGFELSDEDMKCIEGLNKNKRYGADPDTALKGNLAMAVPF